MDDRDFAKIGFERSRHRADRTPAPPEKFENPPGLGGDTCDVDAPVDDVEPCDPTPSEDLVMEESKPGTGIPGYEGEEVGGG
jgi:hypothetical protein